MSADHSPHRTKIGAPEGAELESDHIGEKAARPPTPGPRAIVARVRFRERMRRFAPLLALLAVAALTLAITPSFYRPSNLANIARQASPLLVLAIAQTCVLITRGIDLSQAAIMQAAAIGLVVWVGGDTSVATVLVAVLALGGALGLLNGVFVSYGRIPPFIATLAVGISVTGVRLVLTEGIASGPVPPLVRRLGVGTLAGVPYGMLLALSIAFCVLVILRRTTAGRRLYATGANPQAARASGIRVRVVLISTYTSAGVLAALAGLLLAGHVGFADRNIGAGAELDSIAAAVIGGASFAGGHGSVGGTLAGVCVLSMLVNLVLLLGLPAGAQLVMKGVVIVVGLALYQRLRK